MQDRIRKVLLGLLMQPLWSPHTGFGFDGDYEACDEAIFSGLIERWFDDQGFVQYRLTDRGKEYLNADS